MATSETIAASAVETRAIHSPEQAREALNRVFGLMSGFKDKLDNDHPQVQAAFQKSLILIGFVEEGSGDFNQHFYTNLGKTILDLDETERKAQEKKWERAGLADTFKDATSKAAEEARRENLENMRLMISLGIDPALIFQTTKLPIEVIQAFTKLEQQRKAAQAAAVTAPPSAPEPPKRKGMVRRRALQLTGVVAGAAALAATAKLGRFAFDVLAANKQAINTYITYDPNVIFTGPSPAEKYKQSLISSQNSEIKQSLNSSLGSEYKGVTQTEAFVQEASFVPTVSPTKTPQAQPTATAEPTVTPEPTPEPTEMVGNANMAEFFFGDLLNLFKYRREERVLFEPGARERLMPALLSGDQITFLYLGFDETRARYKEFAGNGKGRSDVIMLVSINPHTLQMIEVGIPRDTTTPSLRGNKINAMTAGVIPGNVLEISRTIVEELTGVPIDAIVQSNIDTVQGFNGIKNGFLGSEHPGIYYPGIFDVLAPDGIVINVPRQIIDNEYPVGYGTKRLVIKAGPQRMNGEQAVEYARSRHQDMDFGRSANQRDVMFALFKVLAVDGRDYLLTGDNKIFDKINLFISFLEREEQNGDIHYNEVNFTQIVKTIQQGIVRLRNDPQGKAILSRVALNSIPAVSNLLNNSQSVFKSFGPSFENGMLTSVAPNDTRLKLVGSSLNSSPIEYSQPLRKKIKELFGIS